LIANYRDAYSIYGCTGILFNHESPLRPARFVTQKIVQCAARIATDSKETLQLGNLNIYRDWGWAPEYVQAMWLMLQQDAPADYVIATGHTVSLSYFVEKAFSYFDLDWHAHVHADDSLLRPSDIAYGAGDPSLAEKVLGWIASCNVDAVISNMCHAMTLK